MASDIWDAAEAATYDADAAEMFSEDAVRPAVDFLADLAGSGPVLEFAIGTGRLGIPLLQRGITVSGIELSPAMLARLRQKVSDADLPVALGDMATAVVPGKFSVVFLAWNGISNLKTQQEQVACFRNAARHLVPGGCFVIELWVPPLRRLPPGQLAVPFDVSESHLGFDTYDPVRSGTAAGSSGTYGRPSATSWRSWRDWNARAASRTGAVHRSPRTARTTCRSGANRGHPRCERLGCRAADL